MALQIRPLPPKLIPNRGIENQPTISKIRMKLQYLAPLDFYRIHDRISPSLTIMKAFGNVMLKAYFFKSSRKYILKFEVMYILN
jgi:hypothetical protein